MSRNYYMEGMAMPVLHPAELLDLVEESERKVCVYCDKDTSLPYCFQCHEYKGLMTIAEWEEYTGEVWED